MIIFLNPYNWGLIICIRLEYLKPHYCVKIIVWKLFVLVLYNGSYHVTSGISDVMFLKQVGM